MCVVCVQWGAWMVWFLRPCGVIVCFDCVAMWYRLQGVHLLAMYLHTISYVIGCQLSHIFSQITIHFTCV